MCGYVRYGVRVCVLAVCMCWRCACVNMCARGYTLCLRPMDPDHDPCAAVITVMDNGARRTEATFLQDYLLPRMHDIFEHDGVSDIWRHQLEMCSPSQRDLEEMVER